MSKLAERLASRQVRAPAPQPTAQPPDKASSKSADKPAAKPAPQPTAQPTAQKNKGGRPRIAPEMSRTSIYLPSDRLAALRQAAFEDDLSLAGAVSEAVAMWLESRASRGSK